MKKNYFIVAGILAIMIAISVAIILFTKKEESTIKSTDDILKMLNEIYKGLDLPSLENQVIDVTDKETVKYFTGITSDIETLVVSEPLMNAQAYSLIVVKAKDSGNIEKIKQEIYDNIDMSKWICVSADKLYITNSGNIIFAVMSSEDMAKPVYEKFKEYVNNNVGKELEKGNASGIDSFITE